MTGDQKLWAIGIVCVFVTLVALIIGSTISTQFVSARECATMCSNRVHSFNARTQTCECER